MMPLGDTLRELKPEKKGYQHTDEKLAEINFTIDSLFVALENAIKRIEALEKSNSQLKDKHHVLTHIGVDD